MSKSRNNSPSKGKSLAKQVDGKIKCTLVGGNTVEGILHVHDQKAHIIVIYTSLEDGVYSDLRIINTNNIVSYDDDARKDADRQAKPKTKVNGTTTPDSRRGSRSETPNKQPLKVSEECRMTTDALSRQYKCRLQGATIIVAEQFKIEAPYTPDQTTALTATFDAAALQKLKRVLESERNVQKKTPVRRKKDEKLPVKGG